MNVVWIVADTFRRDHIGAYGNPTIKTPSLDALAAGSVRFDRHYSAGFPTMPTRAGPSYRSLDDVLYGMGASTSRSNHSGGDPGPAMAFTLQRWWTHPTIYGMG